MAIEWREDGSIAFTAGDDIVWVPPTVDGFAAAKNAHSAIIAAGIELTTTDEATIIDDVEAELTSLVGGWIDTVHADVGTGRLPKHFGDRPHWMGSLYGFRFISQVVKHWGTNPFDLRTTTEEQQNESES